MSITKMRLLLVAILSIFLIGGNTAQAKVEERGDDNYPKRDGDTSTDELTYPYFNVHYHFNKYNWNRILDDQQKLIALRRRISKIRRNINDDMKHAANFMLLQDSLLKDARSSLFERALYRTTHPGGTNGFQKHPMDVHDRLHLMNDDFYRPTPSSDFLDVNEPYYYQMLAEQRI